MSDKGTESRSESLHEKVAAVSQEEAPVKEEDLAYGGEDTLPPPPTLTAEEEKRLWRKIDMKLMPILTLMYLCSFLDRGNIGASPSALVKEQRQLTGSAGNARLQGLTTQLNLTGDKYNIALVSLFTEESDVPPCLLTTDI